VPRGAKIHNAPELVVVHVVPPMGVAAPAEEGEATEEASEE